jgi:hypothetical protein
VWRCPAGWAVSAFYGYLQGVNNDLALKHVPHVIPRKDNLAGPAGRRGDQVCTFEILYSIPYQPASQGANCCLQSKQVGGFTMMRTEDLTKVLPLWIKYTEDVRADPEVCFTHLIIYLNTESVVQFFRAWLGTSWANLT